MFAGFRAAVDFPFFSLLDAAFGIMAIKQMNVKITERLAYSYD
jgi:hypothetical protein